MIDALFDLAVVTASLAFWFVVAGLMGLTFVGGWFFVAPEHFAKTFYEDDEEAGL